MNAETIAGMLIPFAGTCLGAAMVFVLRKSISDGMQKILTGFAAGVMVAASYCLQNSQNLIDRYIQEHG